MIHHEQPSRVRRDQAPFVVGVDGSSVSELATAIAFAEASCRAVDLVSLDAVGDAEPPAPVRASGETGETLAGSLWRWPERYPDVTVRRHTSVGDPAQVLLDTAPNAQLLVVGSRGRGGSRDNCSAPSAQRSSKRPAHR